MDVDAQLMADTFEGIKALAVLVGGWLMLEMLSRRIYRRRYPDYDRHLSYAEHMFIDGEFDRALAYRKGRQYPKWFRFVWLRDMAIIAFVTFAVIFAVFMLEFAVKLYTGGLAEDPTDGRLFQTGVRAPLAASLLGISLGVWVTVQMWAGSRHYRKFAQYVAAISRKRAVMHLEHFYRARLITHEWLTGEPDLLMMIHERYTPALKWAIGLTAALTILVFGWDILSGL